MIKTSELMLGDLVRLADGQIAKVVSLYKNHKGSGGEIIVDSDLKIFNSLVRDEDINPIPLTAEILENNGFVFKSSECSKIDCFILEFYNGFVEIDNFDGLYFYAMLTCKETKLEYVHQLQHLLRMCGLNEVADNLKI